MASEQTVPFPERRVRRARRGPPEFKAERPAYSPLPTGLEGLFRLVSTPVLKLEKAPRDQLTLREISIVLGDILDLLEEDRSIIRAADRLDPSARLRPAA